MSTPESNEELHAEAGSAFAKYGLDSHVPGQVRAGLALAALQMRLNDRHNRRQDVQRIPPELPIAEDLAAETSVVPPQRTEEQVVADLAIGTLDA